MVGCEKAKGMRLAAGAQHVALQSTPYDDGSCSWEQPVGYEPLHAFGTSLEAITTLPTANTSGCSANFGPAAEKCTLSLISRAYSYCHANY